MKKLAVILAATAAISAVTPALAETLVVRSGYHHPHRAAIIVHKRAPVVVVHRDRGWHRGWHHADRVVIH